MSNDTVMTVTVKGIGDFSDVVSNVGSVQKALTKLKLPDKIGDNLSKNITNFYKEYEKYQKKISEGIKTQGDYNQVEKSLNNMRNLYQAIGKDAQKLTELDMKDILNLDTGEFKKIMDEMTSVMKQIGSVKIDTSPFTKAFKDIQGITKNSKIVGEDGLLNKIIGSINTGQIAEAKKQLQELQNYAKKVAPRITADGKQAPGTLSTEKYQQLTSAINTMNGAVTKAEAAINPLIEKHNNLQKELDETKQKAAQSIKNEFKGYNQASSEVEKLTDSLRRMHEEEFNFNREAQNIDRQIQSYFGLSQMIRKVGDIARDAFATVKELDAAMTQTAVVTNFSVGDMWDMLPTYTQQANQLGSTIKDVYEAATLYYQQGLNTNQAMGLANETLKMARIAGLDAAEATNMMTAALRGFNMEINQASAQKINDIYSELAAITASDTKEIGSAMERTASIANAANMDFATTSAFLAQMIETTREAPENLGTAMKTIVARFQEMKQDPTKLVDSEGVAMDVNKVDKALKTIGVSLTNTKGEFRDLDDVFLDISAKWDSLSQGQQRYIATIAAGSRQQSRFIAMMSDYERTMELVDAANNSAGASQRQFEKTLDSMEAKLNKLKNAWDQFTMGLMNNQLIKLGVDALTKVFTITNKIIDVLGSIPAKPFEGITKSVLTLVATLSMLNFGKKASRGLVMGGAAWFKGEQGGFIKNFAQGFKSGSAEAQNGGKQAGITWSQAVSKAINSKSGTIKEAMHQAFNMQEVGSTNLIQQNLTLALQKIQAASNNFGMGENGKEAGDAFVEGLVEEVNNGQTSINGALQQALDMGETDLNIDDLGEEIQQASRASLDLNKISTNFKDLTKTASSAGDSIRDFGYALQGTPLEGFGNTLIRIGNLMDSASRTAQTFGKNFNKAMEAAGKASGVGGKASTFLGTMFPNLSKIIGLIGKLPLQLKIIGAVLAIVGAIVLKTAHDQKKALESATDAAAAASDAYDSAKQETSELADSIEKIKDTDSAFDGLVAGTAAFNEQLVAANQQIMELITKYPMLNNREYLTTDKNGLMHISDEGLEAVKEYQKQRQANASALNLIQTADLDSEETRQKVKQMRKTKGTDTRETLEQRKKEADLLEQQAEAQQQMAKLNAVNAALVDKEISNREKVSSVMADQYDARKDAISLEGESIHDLKQEYADFYGYTYDKSTKKIKDVEGNEIDVSDDTIKDAVKDIRVITDIEVDASSVEGVLHSLDRDFSKTLGDSFENSSTFISDILSNNAETNEDLLEQVLDNPEQLNDFVEGLSAKEIAAVLGASEEAVESNVNDYKQQLEDKLLTNARNIIDTNAQANGELAAMLAQAQGKTTNEVLNSKEIQNNLMQQVKDFTSEQRNTLLNIGKTLETSVGSEAMSTFINGLSDIYQTGNEELITTAQNWADSVNWDTAIGRLKGYNEAINMTTDNTNHLGEESVKQINNLGQALLNSQDEANLLGEAFAEFYNSTDFQDMAENMDKFVDSSGRLNAASIMDMAEECGSLNSLLNTGAVSAGGVAAALNALGSDGDLVLSDLNSKVLELLSNFGQLDGIIASSHRNIENFDWGIDTGEAEDFVKDSAEKWNELYNNGEVGNPQLEAYAKWVMGEDKYIALLASKHGDLEATMAEVSKSVNLYSDGFEAAWDKLANGSWEKVNFTDDLKDLGIKVSFDDNGDWKFEPGQATTEQLQKWLQQALEIGPEMAQAMIEDWSNYSPDFRAERQKNDFQAGLDSYVEQRRGANGEVAITASELDTIVSATGQEKDEVIAAIADKANIDAEQVEVLKNIDENTGEYVTDGAVLNKELSQTLGANGQNGWLAKYQATDSNGNLMKNTIDIEDAMAAAVERGYTEAQAQSMAYESYTNAEQQGKDYYYKGELLEVGDYKTLDQFAERLAEIDQNEQWVTIGQTMADAWIARIDEHENGQTQEPNQPDSSTQPQSSTPTVVKPSQQGNRYTDTGTGGKESYTNSYSKAEEQQYSRGIVAAIKELIPPLKEKNEPTELTPAQQQKMYGTSSPESDKADESNDNLQEAATKLQESGTQIETAASKLETGASKVESAASKLETAASNLLKPEGLNSKNSTIPNGSTVPGVGFVSSDTQSTNGNVSVETSEADTKVTALQTKLKELNDLVNQGGTYKLKISGVSDIKAAATAAKTLTKNSGVKTIGVKTGKADTSSVDKATRAIDNTEAKIKVGATVDSAIAAARRAQHTISGMSAIIDVEAHVRKTGINSITIDGKTVTIDTAASGKHNHGYAPAPSFGSAARGRYGQVGPKGKGGLTLTGELGYEVAWLPDENRSMILGANGPQMIDLPGNAVVWDHEQSKKIVKQKAIPAGSHSRRPKKDKPSNNATNTDDSNTTTSNGNQTTKKTEDALKAIARVTVWWENAARRAEAIQRKMDKNQDTYEKYLKDIQATLKGTGKAGGNQFIKNSEAYIEEQQRQFKQARNELIQLSGGKWQDKKRKGKKATSAKTKNKKYNQKAFEQGAVNIAEISYEGKNSKGKKVNITRYVDLSEYIYKDKKTGAYQVSQTALNNVKNKDRRRAIADAANKEVNDRISKKNAAEDNIKKAQDALEKLSEQLHETFFGWKNELTQIWELTQQIASVSGRIDTSSAYDELLDAQIASGIGNTAALQARKTANLAGRLGLQQTNIGKRSQQIELTKQDLMDMWTGTDIVTAINNVQKTLARTDLSKSERGAYEKELKALQDDRAVLDYVHQFTKLTQNADGTLNIDFDSEGFEAMRGTMHKDMADRVQEMVKALQDGSTNLEDLYQTQLTELAGLYQSVADLKKQRADQSRELLNQYIENKKQEVENTKTLYDAIGDATKELIDNVKSNLEERRKREDNTKTEQDISKKQQRLAMLRADTSGGHQSEIAQLEKEIAESQQSYGRTLEDQTLDRLSKQNDIAQKQRDRQITLAEALVDQSIQNGEYAKTIDAWLENPSKYMPQITELLKQSMGYDSMTKAEKEVADSELETAKNNILTYNENLGLFDTAITNAKTSLEALETVLSKINKTPTSVVGPRTAKEAKEVGLTSTEALQRGFSGEEVQKAYGESAKDLQKKVNENKMAQATMSHVEVKGASKTNKGKELKGQLNTSGTKVGTAKGSSIETYKWDSKKGESTGKAKTISVSGMTATTAKAYPQEVKEALLYAFKNTDTGKTINKNMPQIFEALKAQGINLAGTELKLKNGLTGIVNSKGIIFYKGHKDKNLGVYKWDTSTGKRDFEKYNKKNFIDKAKKYKTSIGKIYAAALKDKGITKYASGGLANFTGPAWLDGTPSKPELVLNAADTQNFLALRDVLSKVLGSTNSVTNSYGGNATYEININVDKIEKDYDVDKVAERVKKIIVKDSGYRNVTQVRNFR